MSNYPGKELESMTFAVNYHRWIVEDIAPHLGPVTVEVGAGKGDLSALLLSTAVETLHAFEPANDLFATLERKFQNASNVKLTNGFFTRESAPARIDSVIYVNVLEHIEDDFEELQTVRDSLPAGGSLVVFVPALPWLFSRADREMGHFRRYTRSSLVGLVEKVGFRISKAHYFDSAGIIPWYVNFVLLKNSFNPGSVLLYDRLVVPPMKFIERRVTPPIGKNLLLVASKP